MLNKGKNDGETEKGSHMSYKVTKCFILANREKLPKSTYQLVLCHDTGGQRAVPPFWHSLLCISKKNSVKNKIDGNAPAELQE